VTMGVTLSLKFALDLMLKSAGLHHKKHGWLAGLRWLFRAFCLQVPDAGDKCGTKTVTNLLSNTVYCLNLLFVCFDVISVSDSDNNCKPISSHHITRLTRPT